MTRRQRLMAAIEGRAVDRTPVSFYEIGGFRVDPANPDPFNIYNDPSWQPLLRLAEEKTDLIRMRGPAVTWRHPDVRRQFIESRSWLEDGTRFSRTRIRVGGRELTSLARRDPEIDTTWTIEHLLKDDADARAYLELPDEFFARDADVAPLVEADAGMGESGIVMMDTADPICCVASLFAMETYTVLALTEPALFHALLQKEALPLYHVTEQVARAWPGHLWRIVGPEYAGEPYLPPRLFEDYVVRYTRPIVQLVRQHGGYPRLHCHGRLRNIVHFFADMGATGLDPCEPPPQGDIELAELRRRHGRDLTLFGNLEVSDIECLEPDAFERVVARALAEGTAGDGRGFVLMPSAAPYGRQITPRVLRNYETMVRLATGG
jgi:hypothetical protein